MTPAEYNKTIGKLTPDILRLLGMPPVPTNWEAVARRVSHWQASVDLAADGCFGPMSFARWVELSARPAPSALALAAVAVAISEIGNGEAFQDNAGEDLHRYRNYPYGTDYKKPIGHWCEFFVNYCFRATELPLPFAATFMDTARKKMMPIGSAKALGYRVAAAGSTIDAARNTIRGDLLIWDRGFTGSPAGHIEIVENNEEGNVHTIAGNSTKFPCKVRRRVYTYAQAGNRLELIARV